MAEMKNRIEEKLRNALDPTLLEVVNDSCNHKGHSGDDGSGESHFIVSISSDKFSGISKVKCQRMIYDILKEEMQLIHSLSIVLKT